MRKRDLIIHLPVVHKGYLDFFDRNKKIIDKIYILHNDFLKILSEIKPDIASLDNEKVKSLLESMGFKNVMILKKTNVKRVGKNLILVNDDVSRNLSKKFLKSHDIQWENVFLRWDKSSVVSTIDTESKISKNSFDKKMIVEAYDESKKSSDWWRQVGAVLVKNNKIILKSYNYGIPTDHTPYQVGGIRDFLEVGQSPELSPTIHAEQVIVSMAAKEGISLKGSSLYLTHFPCAVCAKLIAYSGIKKCFFGEGSSNLEGKKTMESKGVEIFLVKNRVNKK